MAVREIGALLLGVALASGVAQASARLTRITFGSLALLTADTPSAQESKPTVRHHRVIETEDDTSSPEVEQAESAMQHNDYASAEMLLRKAVAAKPDDYRAWFDLGFVLNAEKKTPDAIDAYRKAVAAQPDVFESNLNLGILLARQGDNAEAAKYLKAATELKPTAADPDEALARAWQTLGRVQESLDPQQAIASFNQAAKLQPKDPEPHLSAGLLLEKQGQFDASAAQFQAASELDPRSTEALAGLVNVYTRENKLPDAEAALRKLLALDPANNNARVQLGRVLAAQGKNDEAAQELQSGLHADPNDPQAALELGTLYVKAGKDSEAEQQFRLAVQKMPQNAEAHYALGSVLMHEKKYDESQQELLIALKLKPDLPDEAYGNLAVVAAENKNYELAIRALDARAKLVPDNAATYFLRATCFDHLQQVKPAVEYYQRFLAAAGDTMPDQQWQARHRLIALDPKNRSKYEGKK